MNQQYGAYIGNSFNPCFNGSMYKNTRNLINQLAITFVSILVLMDLCIKTEMTNRLKDIIDESFNPCFNGSMYKNTVEYGEIEGLPERFNPCFNGSMYKNDILLGRYNLRDYVSILVLMDLCIKTIFFSFIILRIFLVSILVLMDLCIKTENLTIDDIRDNLFQSLF